MLKLHHLEQSRSLRILWLLEELGLKYALETYSRDPETLRAPASMTAGLPMAKSPILEDDGKIIVESGAITEYLTHVKAGGKLAHGPDSPHFADYQQWMHFVEGSVMPPLVYEFISNTKGCDNEGLQGFIDGEAATCFGFIDKHLAQHAFLVADAFSAADVNLSFALEFGEQRGKLRGYAHLKPYLDRLQARPAYKTAPGKGGNHDLSVFSTGVG